MQVRLWGTRGSIPAPGPQTNRYGGETSCVDVLGPGGTYLILDGGSGMRILSGGVPKSVKVINILLTHLHMDHIQGLGMASLFFYRCQLGKRRETTGSIGSKRADPFRYIVDGEGQVRILSLEESVKGRKHRASDVPMVVMRLEVRGIAVSQEL